MVLQPRSLRAVASPHESLVILYPDTDFVAKSHILDFVAEPIKLQAFTSVGARG